MSPRALQKTCSLGSASTDPGTGLSEEAPVSSTSPFPSANAQPTPLSSPQLVPRLKKDTEQASLFPALFIPLCNSLCALFILHSYELTTFFLHIDPQQIVGDEDSAPDASNNLSPVTNPIPSPTISLLSPRATQMEGCIRICEEKHRAKAKVAKAFFFS